MGETKTHMKPVVWEEPEADDSCEHGWSYDNRRGCVECVTDRADWLRDDMEENGGSCAKCVADHAEGES